MKISASKEQLAKIISENGGWRDGAEFAWLGNLTKKGWFGRSKPWYVAKEKTLRVIGVDAMGSFPCSKFNNWHQTILSRDEYFHLYPAPDADGWIEWNGGERPVDAESVVCYKMRDGGVFKRGEPAADVRWAHIDRGTDIIAYRLHKAETTTSTVIEPKPTIEQLAAEYRNRKDYAERKQQEADEAKAEAEAKLAELVAAGKAVGLALSVATLEPELVITDWRDLKEGDLIEIASVHKADNTRHADVIGKHARVVKIGEIMHQQLLVSPIDVGKKLYIDGFKFIRRPAKESDNA